MCDFSAAWEIWKVSQFRAVLGSSSAGFLLIYVNSKWYFFIKFCNNQYT